ncbi:MAG: DUF5996 family protein [Mycobacterium leprae]
MTIPTSQLPPRPPLSLPTEVVTPPGWQPWPELAYDEWRETLATLHMLSQMVGKTRLALAPPEPQWAHVALPVTVEGLTTGPMPIGTRVLQIDIDLVAHQVRVATADGVAARFPIADRSVADLYGELTQRLRDLGCPVEINPVPKEVPDPVPFVDNTERVAYDGSAARRFLTVLLFADRALKRFRAPFAGRHTPVQFYWGTFDLGYVRYSGQPARAPEGDVILHYAMNAEEIAFGFWPGDTRYPRPAFYSYTYPRPGGIDEAPIAPAGAAWNSDLGEFLLPYDVARHATAPEEAVLAFLQASYDAGVRLGGWPPEFR